MKLIKIILKIIVVYECGIIVDGKIFQWPMDLVTEVHVKLFFIITY